MKNAIISAGEWNEVVILSSNIIRRLRALFWIKPLTIPYSSDSKKNSDLHVSPFECQPQQHICVFPKSLHIKFIIRRIPLKKVKMVCRTVLNHTVGWNV